jgi:hypothetical protein
MKLGIAEASGGRKLNAAFDVDTYHLDARLLCAHTTEVPRIVAGGQEPLVGLAPLWQLCLDVILLIRSHFNFGVERLVSRQGNLDVVFARAE